MVAQHPASGQVGDVGVDFPLGGLAAQPAQECGMIDGAGDGLSVAQILQGKPQRGSDHCSADQDRDDYCENA
jgi:hypothetical protein